MIQNAPIYGSETSYKIRSHEVDASQYLRASALLVLMQETSMDNALKLEISIWDERMGSSSWVILRKEVTIIRSVKFGEKIRVITYPAGFDRILAYRDFLVYNEANELVATASSTWTLMNLETRKIERIRPEFYDLAYDGETLPRPASKLTISDTITSSYLQEIRYGDLDWNGHVNNIVYTRLMMQASPEELLRNRKLHTFKFHIKSECMLGETVKVTFSAHSENESHYKILSENDGRLISMAIAEWI